MTATGSPSVGCHDRLKVGRFRADGFWFAEMVVAESAIRDWVARCAERMSNNRELWRLGAIPARALPCGR